jgi:uncharacterized protein (DUF111 family)
MRPLRVGCGAGSRDLGDHPNMLRVVLGSADGDARGGERGGEVVVVECTVDDVSPQTLAWACERMLDAGALDVSTTALTGKKGRAGHRVTALARPEDFDAVARCMLAETSTLGLRYRTESRIEVARSSTPVATPYGVVRVKLGRLDGRLIRVAPEYDDCVALARRHRVPLIAVQQAALAAARRRTPRGVARPTRRRR